MSCNGCRVLRQGCSEDCTLRPCLEWVKTPQSQSNATLFLAKFYGRAGLFNLINAGPTQLRPAIFKSLLFEACGRIINPVYGSVGLISSGNWQRCQAAVEAVLQGSPLVTRPIPGQDDDSCTVGGFHQRGDIRHISKKFAATLHGVKTGHRFKRSGVKNCVNSLAQPLTSESGKKFTITGWDYNSGEDYKEFEELNRAPSHDSYSVETLEPALVNRVELPIRKIKPELQTNEVGLELTLGLDSTRQTYLSTVIEISDSEA